MIAVALGGFLGAITRYVFYLFAESRSRNPKWATWWVNSAGSFGLGAFAASGSESVFWMMGFLGAFTTFSTMALDAVKDFEDGRLLHGASYLAVTILSGILLFSTAYKIL